MSDEHLDDLVRELARDYRREGSELDGVRREAMWTAIAARRGRPARIAPRRIPSMRRWWPAAAAALILVGIGIGRILPSATNSSPAPRTDVVSAEPELRWKSTSPQTLSRLAARGFLQTTQTELTRYQLASAAGESDEAEVPMTDWAGGLLVRTRIFLDSPLAQDPSMRDLLEDLEVVLARIVETSGDVSQREEAFILEGMRRRDILERLQQSLPDKTNLQKPASRT